MAPQFFRKLLFESSDTPFQGLWPDEQGRSHNFLAKLLVYRRTVKEVYRVSHEPAPSETVGNKKYA
jgi:hypothetical protein